MLLRVFCNSTGRHNRPSDYGRNIVPNNELQIYTWMDATLKELSRLITEVYPEMKTKGTRFHFSSIFPSNRDSSYLIRDLGAVVVGTKGNQDTDTLKQLRFTVGDFMDVSISVASGNDDRQNSGRGDRDRRGGGGGGGRDRDRDRRGGGGSGRDRYNDRR